MFDRVDAVALRRDPAPRRGVARSAGSRPRPATSTTSVNAWEEGARRSSWTSAASPARSRARPVRARWASCSATCGSTPTCTATCSTSPPARRTETQLDDANTEFPTIDTRGQGTPDRLRLQRAHRRRRDASCSTGCCGYDRDDRAARPTTGSATGRFGSEAPFAPRDGSTGEDDGYLVCFVTDERDGRSEVEILDAADLAAGPVARVRLPQRVPLGFHATWVRADQFRTVR